MGTLAPSPRVVQLLRLLPAPVLRLLDAWSHRVAKRRQQRRQQAWVRRHAVALPVAPAAHTGAAPGLKFR
jgi:hypothetical protein